MGGTVKHVFFSVVRYMLENGKQRKGENTQNETNKEERKMVKRIAALLIVAVMLCGVALAEEGKPLNETLTELTALVKERYGIGDTFDEFTSNYTQELYGERWNLSWSSDTEYVSIFCDGEGYLYDYSHDYYLTGHTPQYDPYFAPHYPSVDVEGCRAVAENFLQNALHENEGFVFDSLTQDLYGYSAWGDACSFSGKLLRDGLEMDINFYIAVNADTMQVTSFWRGDSWTGYSLQEGEISVDAETAEQRLKENIRMELVYVGDETQENQAVLRYVPVADEPDLLNAVTGEFAEQDGEMLAKAESLSSLNAYYDAGASASAGLTQAELEGIGRMEGVCTQEELDACARAIEEIGITDAYTLDSVRYHADEESVTATLQYETEMDEAAYSALLGVSGDVAATAYAMYGNGLLTRSVTLDAHTGELVSCSVYGTEYYNNDMYREIVVDVQQAQEKAEAFLSKYFPDLAQDTSVRQVKPLADTMYSNPWVQVVFTRMENDIPYLNDGITINVNMATGNIDYFAKTWSDDVVFESPQGVVGEEAAYEAYCAAATVALSWRAMPEEEGSELTNIYGRYYSLEPETGTVAIDAKDGSILQQDSAQQIAYSDLAGEEVEEVALRLAAYSVGFPGGTLQPEKEITLREVLCLLMQASGYSNAWELPDEDLVNMASNSWIPLEGVQLDAVVTRGQLCRILLDMSGYGAAAELLGAVDSGFSDDASFTAQERGYYLLGKEMGIALADEEGSLAPQQPLTRAQALVMLDAFLSK